MSVWGISWYLRQRLLCRDFALPVVHPVDLARTQLPLVAQGFHKFDLGEAWRKSPTYQLLAGLGRLGAAGRLLSRKILLEERDGQDAIGAEWRGHAGGLLSSSVAGSKSGKQQLGQTALLAWRCGLKQPVDC
jgi:hypothetical protein